MKYLPSQIEIKSKSYHCRTLLINVLRRQYASFDPDWVDSILQPLASERCFAITCAHQANLLGGLCIGGIKSHILLLLAREATRLFPDYQFVPIYYYW
ncbi:MAG: bacillithiol biosynthesis BshC [Saprospiraceae bacterium]